MLPDYWRQTLGLIHRNRRQSKYNNKNGNSFLYLDRGIIVIQFLN